MNKVFRLKDCSRAVVYGTDNKKLSNARVLDTGSSVYLFFDNPNLRQAHVKVYIDFYKSTGIVRCWCDLNIRKNKQIGDSQEVWAADCKILELIKVIQRHKDFRVRINMPVFYSTEFRSITRGVIKNISAGGVYLVTNEMLKNGTRISYEHMLDGRLCEIKAYIVYGMRVEGSYKYGYGCCFDELSTQTLNTIRSWCHDHQERKILD